MADWVLAVFVVTGAVIYLRAAMNLERLQVGDALGPQVFPVIVAAVMLCSGLLLAWETWRKQTMPGPAPTQTLPPKRGREGRGSGPTAEERRQRLVLPAMAAWTALYYVAFEPVGYVPSTLVYLSALLFYFHRVNPLINIGYAAAFTAVAYLLFTNFLQVVLPAGILQF
ncbi:MAG TPA: tripartite tricarboxylate transporter TctB family protein [Xanthobacteraceae bacterium]